VSAPAFETDVVAVDPAEFGELPHGQLARRLPGRGARRRHESLEGSPLHDGELQLPPRMALEAALAVQDVQDRIGRWVQPQVEHAPGGAVDLLDAH
jgi:hypothetical protein